MPDPLDVTARLKAKGLDGTGVSEEIARAMASRLGNHYLLIVEVSVDEVNNKAEGVRQVKLAVTRAEPVPEQHEETVREFMRSLYRSRPEQEGQAVLQGTTDQGLSVDDAASAIAAQVERDEEGEPTGVWDGDPDAPLDGGDKPEDAGGGHVVQFSGRG